MDNDECKQTLEECANKSILREVLKEYDIDKTLYSLDCMPKIEFV